jgi:hypothetical protein
VYCKNYMRETQKDSTVKAEDMLVDMTCHISMKCPMSEWRGLVRAIVCLPLNTEDMCV